MAKPMQTPFDEAQAAYRQIKRYEAKCKAIVEALSPQARELLKVSQRQAEAEMAVHTTSK